MIQWESKRRVKISGQQFDATPFRCIADATGELLFEGLLSIDSVGVPYILKVEPRMNYREMKRVLEAYQVHLFTKKTGRPR